MIFLNSLTLNPFYQYLMIFWKKNLSVALINGFVSLPCSATWLFYSFSNIDQVNSGIRTHWTQIVKKSRYFDLYSWQLPSLFRLSFKLELISFRLDLEFTFTFSDVTCPNVATGRTRITPKFNFSEKEKLEKFGRPITHKELKSFSLYFSTWRLQIIDLYVALDWNNI